MDSETKSSETKKKYQKIPINNSFIRDKYIWDRENELYDKVKVRISGDIRDQVLWLLCWRSTNRGIFFMRLKDRSQYESEKSIKKLRSYDRRSSDYRSKYLCITFTLRLRRQR